MPCACDTLFILFVPAYLCDSGLPVLIYDSQDAEAMEDPEFKDPPPENAEKESFDSFQQVVDNGTKIEVDHWIVYYTRGYRGHCAL